MSTKSLELAHRLAPDTSVAEVVMVVAAARKLVARDTVATVMVAAKAVADNCPMVEAAEVAAAVAVDHRILA